MKEASILFWSYVAQAGKPTPAKEGSQAEGETKKASAKKSSKDIVFEFTNGILSSKVKIQYGFGGGLELLQHFIYRTCVNYLVKMNLSLPNLAYIEGTLNGYGAALQQAVFGDAADLPFKISGKLFAKQLNLHYDGKEDIPLPDKQPALKADITQNTEALMKAPKDGEKSPAEYLVYQIDPELTNTNPQDQPDYATYITPFHLYLLRAGGRTMVRVYSSHYQDSVEVSVASKITITEIISYLIRKIVDKGFRGLTKLDAGGETCPSTLVYIEKVGAAELGLVAGSADPANKEDGAGTVVHYKKDLGNHYWADVALTTEETSDVKATVRLLKVSEDGAAATVQTQDHSYFPLVAQFCAGVLLSQYVEKYLLDFAGLVISELIRTGKLQEKPEERHKAQVNLLLDHQSPFSVSVRNGEQKKVPHVGSLDAEDTLAPVPRPARTPPPRKARAKSVTSPPKKVSTYSVINFPVQVVVG